MSTGFFVIKSPEHTASFVNTQPQNDEPSDVFQEDDKTTEQSTTSELIPDALGGTERDILKDDNLEHQGETKVPPSSFISEDTNLEHMCTTETRSDPPLLEPSIPAVDNSAVETAPDNPNTHSVVEESSVLSHNSHSDVVEKPSVALTNTEDHVIEELTESPTVKDANDCREEITSPFSPDEDSLTNINYERPEDSEDDPDGFTSILRLRKESIKGEEMIQLQDMADSGDHCVVTLISRRSRYRAGQ